MSKIYISALDNVQKKLFCFHIYFAIHRERAYFQGFWSEQFELSGTMIDHQTKPYRYHTREYVHLHKFESNITI